MCELIIKGFKTKEQVDSFVQWLDSNCANFSETLDEEHDSFDAFTMVNIEDLLTQDSSGGDKEITLKIARISGN